MTKRSAILVSMLFCVACNDKYKSETREVTYRDDYGIKSISDIPVLDAVVEKGESASCLFVLRVETYGNTLPFSYSSKENTEIFINTENISLRVGHSKQRQVLARLDPGNQFACGGHAANFDGAEVLVPDQKTLVQWKKILAHTRSTKSSIVVPRLK